jgi:hypothetical protein
MPMSTSTPARSPVSSVALNPRAAQHGNGRATPEPTTSAVSGTAMRQSAGGIQDLIRKRVAAATSSAGV